MIDPVENKKMVDQFNKSWSNIEDSFENDLTINGVVKKLDKGGLIIDIDGVEAFLPGSHVNLKKTDDFEVFVNQNIELKVLKMNKRNLNVVVSRKVLMKLENDQERVDFINSLEKDQILEGTVQNITEFGVFVTLEHGVYGLVHFNNVSWEHIIHPQEVLQVGQKIKVLVLGFSDDKAKISLGIKQLINNPWDNLSDEVKVGLKTK